MEHDTECKQTNSSTASDCSDTGSYGETNKEMQNDKKPTTEQSDQEQSDQESVQEQSDNEQKTDKNIELPEKIMTRSLNDFICYCNNFQFIEKDESNKAYDFLLYLRYQKCHAIPNEFYWTPEIRRCIPTNFPYTTAQLFKFVIDENIEIIDSLFRKGFVLFHYGFDTQFAVIHGLKKYLKCILSHGAYANKHMSFYLAVVYADNELLRILLDHGACANKKNNFPFALACYVGRNDQAQTLVEYGAPFWIMDMFLFLFPGIMPYNASDEELQEVKKTIMKARKNGVANRKLNEKNRRERLAEMDRINDLVKNNGIYKQSKHKKRTTKRKQQIIT